MLDSRTASNEAPATPTRSRSFAGSAGFLLILGGTVGGGFSHWFIVWLIAAAHGAAGLGNYSIVLAGATPIFIFLGLGLRDVHVSLSSSPSWSVFLRLRFIGLAVALLLLALYCLIAAPHWGIFLGMAAKKVADGFTDIALARIQRQSRFTLLGSLSSASAAATVVAVSLAAWFSASIGMLLACAALLTLVVGLIATLLGRRDDAQSTYSNSVDWRRLFDAAVPVTISTGLMSLIASIPVWFLEANTTPLVVGRFTAAAYLIVAANMFGASVQTILITSYRQRLAAEGSTSMLRKMPEHVRLLTVAAVPIVILVVVAGDGFLRLVYGEGFGATGLELLALSLTAWICIVGYVNSAAMLVLNLYRSQLAVTVATIVGALVPLSVAAVVGTSAWILTGILSMGCAYLARYITSRILLSPGRVGDDVSL